jgi:hydroxypyruvate reductase
VVDGNTVVMAQRLSVDLIGALKRHDTYPALKKLHQLIITGPTGTNVNDLYLLLVL